MWSTQNFDKNREIIALKCLKTSVARNGLDKMRLKDISNNQKFLKGILGINFYHINAYFKSFYRFEIAYLVPNIF